MDIKKNVAPFTGAWIEMFPRKKGYITVCGRTLHGCVD